MGLYKKLILILVAILLVIVIAGFALDYYRNSKFVAFSPLVKVAVNGMNDKVVSIKSQEPFTVDWKTADKLAGAKCTLTGYDSYSNLHRDVESTGEITINGFPAGGVYFYTLGCKSGGKEYSNTVEVDIK
jgi:hypothetical protein